ncbi:hypothetical protein BJX99DRAFT_228046 [Aspergillus californicus]
MSLRIELWKTLPSTVLLLPTDSSSRNNRRNMIHIPVPTHYQSMNNISRKKLQPSLDRQWNPEFSFLTLSGGFAVAVPSTVEKQVFGI